MENTNQEDIKIDEGLYSRQLYVLGHDAMKRMAGSNILIVGLGALGVEIAKNVILAGVKSVTLYDPTLATITDLSAQFYLSESDVGKPRGEISLPKLAELNQYVHISLLEGELTEDKFSQFQVIVVTEAKLKKQLEINNYTHANGIKFISADIRGLFGMAFCDFGPEFVIYDNDGETPKSGIIAGITREAEGVVTVLEETRHNLSDGDYVKFTEIKGDMAALNDSEPRKVKVISPHTFSIGDTTNLPTSASEDGNVSGGIFTQVKMPTTMKFKSLEESLANPDFMITDFAKMDRPAQLHYGFQALDRFAFIHNNGFPLPRDEENADEIYNLAKEIAAENNDSIELDENLLKELSYQCRGVLAPMASVIGGLVAQEVIKAISGKFGPIQQFFYFDSLESLPRSLPPTKENVQPRGTRHDGQVAVFGSDFQEKIMNSKQFLVGAGAIGCEMLKNWAMMGLGSGPQGKIVVTDMDTIEKSNLNRQFLFRSSDVGKLKSAAAAKAVITMNPNLISNVEAHANRVGTDSENLYDDDFFESLDLVTNALDNVDARKYMDRRCVLFRKSLLESGTLGTKGNTQVVIPHLTESYSNSQDPPEKSIPMCTLKNFPNLIDHTIQWSRDLFEGMFFQQAENVNQYLTQPNFISKLLSSGGNPKEIVESIGLALTSERPENFQDCVQWARLQFQNLYFNTISQLLYNFPPGSVTSSGSLFWSGPKREPTPIVFDINEPLHLDFISASANLRAYNFGLQGTTDTNTIKECLSKVVVPEFAPRSGVKIQVQDSDPTGASDAPDVVDELVKALPNPAAFGNDRMFPSEFEKDDDTNFHLDFITAASNLRATNYGIQHADRHTTKGIAGKIIPAIATTTSLITGLVCLELYKVVDNNLDHQRSIEDFKNGFVNLALPFFGFSEPIKAATRKYLDTEFTEWDRFVLETPLTLAQLIEHFKNEHKIDISMITVGPTLVFSPFLPKHLREERLNMVMPKLYEHVSKTKIPEHVKYLQIELMGDSLDGDEIDDIPAVRMRIKE